jgi:hypothetical protein
MKQTIISPISVLAGLVGSMALMAGTDLFNPLIKFIHSEPINALEAGICLIFSVLGFAACFFLLNLLCSYFVPRMNASKKSQQKHKS